MQAKIDNDQINLLPRKEFEGRILVVDNEQTMLEAENILRNQTLLGYDTETRPAFQKGLQYKVSLLQLATADTALLFRLHSIPLSPVIIAVLENKEVFKVGAAIKEDINGMQRLARFRPAGFIDLQKRVAEWGVEELSVKKMAAIVLGIKISKAQRLSNWEAHRLTEAQMDYAAMDAWTCRQIYVELDKIKPFIHKEEEPPKKKKRPYIRKKTSKDLQPKSKEQ